MLQKGNTEQENINKDKRSAKKRFLGFWNILLRDLYLSLFFSLHSISIHLEYWVWLPGNAGKLYSILVIYLLINTTA